MIASIHRTDRSVYAAATYVFKPIRLSSVALRKAKLKQAEVWASGTQSWMAQRCKFLVCSTGFLVIMAFLPAQLAGGLLIIVE
jgi:hypothetical protein